MKCDICGSNNTYIKDYKHSYKIKGEEIKFTSKRRFCKDCNSLVYDSELDDKASKTAISIYNKNYGITKEQIIELRNNYNLSQELFSKIIGCAKKTLISYEKGTSIPNDCYLIVLKSLVANPQIILTLIEANKEQFTSSEIDKIDSKLPNDLSNNVAQLAFDFDTSLSEYNGYTKLSKEKVYNIVLFFADKFILKTKLLKEMFYADFLCYKENCKSISGLEYVKLPLGPVPDQFEVILNNCALEKIIDYKIDFINDNECYKIIPKRKFDASIFDKEELTILKKVKEKFMLFGSKNIVDYSHKEKAFLSTEPLNKISYDFAFDIDLK